MKLAEWIEEYGYDAVADLAKRLGGRRIYMPRRGPAPGAIREVLGDEWAEELRVMHMGERLEIPAHQSVQRKRLRMLTKDHALALLNGGLSISTVCIATGLSRSVIKKIRTSSRGKL